MLPLAVKWTMTNILGELTASIFRAMQSVISVETKANIYQIARRNITEDTYLHLKNRQPKGRGPVYF
jgi:tRNA A58 N-methylase Trm61